MVIRKEGRGLSQWGSRKSQGPFTLTWLQSLWGLGGGDQGRSKEPLTNCDSGIAWGESERVQERRDWESLFPSIPLM